MKVSVILQKKGSTNVATIEPQASVTDAVNTLSSMKIGALVVTKNDKQIAGILSERDIVRRLGSDGAAILTTQVNDIMTSDVETCTSEETALGLLGRMTSGRFRHMPVVDADGRLSGILSIGDVVAARLEEIEAENAAMADMLSG